MYGCALQPDPAALVATMTIGITAAVVLLSVDNVRVIIRDMVSTYNVNHKEAR